MASLLLVGCSSFKSYTFNVETGDKIEVKLDTSSKKYDLRQSDGVFSVTKERAVVLNGVFLTSEMKDAYIEAVESDDNAGILPEKEGAFRWMYQGEAGTEYNRIMPIDGTDNTYVMIASLIDSEEGQMLADTVISNLTITAK